MQRAMQVNPAASGSHSLEVPCGDIKQLRAFLILFNDSRITGLMITFHKKHLSEENSGKVLLESD
jgi:hypothetical protein